MNTSTICIKHFACRSAKYEAWLSTLPNILTEGAIHVTVINKLSVIAKQGSVSYHDALIQKMRPILSNKRFFFSLLIFEKMTFR